MKVIVYEYASGGGYAGQPIPPGVLAEGFGMLRGSVADFKEAGHVVTVLMDARLSKLNPPINADCTIPIFYPKESEKVIANIAKINEAILVIAPETGQTLQSLVEIAEKSGKVSLNCESDAIAKASDKAVMYENLANEGFQTPQTAVLNNKDTLEQIKQAIKREMQYPLVFKPVDGVGCGGLSIVKEETQVEKAVAKVKAQSTNKHFLAQEYIQGESASVSLLSNAKKAFALSLNKQNVTLAEPDEASSYDGGVVPFEHPLKHEAFALAQKVVESIRGLRGYVGVDLIFGEKDIFVVDVNPRLTTSYVGLREVAGFNIADALLNAVLKGKFPAKSESRGFACFSKTETATPTFEAFRKAAKLDMVVSPPFPLEDNANSCALVLGRGESLKNASIRLEEAKKHLLNIIS